MNRATVIDYYLERSKEKDFELDQIRKELEQKNIPDEEIRAITKVVDNELQREILTKSTNSKSNELFWAGVILTILGAAITIGTYTGIIPMGKSFMIVYGPFFAGLSLIAVALAKRRS